MNPYQALNIELTATADEITRAYRKAAAGAHPDNQQTGDAQKFQEIARAYSILGDETKRSIYDQTGIAIGEDTLADQAILLLVDLVGEIVMDGRTVNLLFDLRIALKNTVGGTQRAITRIEKSMMDIEARWAGADSLRKSVLANLKSRADALRAQGAVHRRAEEMLKDVRYGEKSVGERGFHSS